MGIFKRKIFIYKNGDHIAIVNAHSKEEAMCKFVNVFNRDNITGDMIQEAKFDFCDVEIIRI